MLEDTNISGQAYDIVPIEIIDEYSETEFYYGTSINGSDVNRNIWRIKKMSKVENIWNLTLFPDGDQSFSYSWSERLNYVYC